MVPLALAPVTVVPAVGLKRTCVPGGERVCAPDVLPYVSGIVLVPGPLSAVGRAKLMLRLTPCGLLTLQVAAALSLTEPCPGNPSGKRRSPPLVSVSPAGAMSIVANAGDNLVCAAAIPGSTSAVTHPRCFLTLGIEPPFWAFAVVRYLPDAGYHQRAWRKRAEGNAYGASIPRVAKLNVERVRPTPREHIAVLRATEDNERSHDRRAGYLHVRLLIDDRCPRMPQRQPHVGVALSVLGLAIRELHAVQGGHVHLPRAPGHRRAGCAQRGPTDGIAQVEESCAPIVSGQPEEGTAQALREEKT